MNDKPTQTLSPDMVKSIEQAVLSHKDIRITYTKEGITVYEYKPQKLKNKPQS